MESYYVLTFAAIAGALLGGFIGFFPRRNRVNELTEQTKNLYEELRSESEKRSAAEERGSRIPELDRKISELRETDRRLREKNSELATRLEGERESANEKLAFIEQARKNLSDTFTALADNALKSNNQSFLDLAKTSLQAFQENARGDLTARKKAIDELIAPIRDSLGAVDMTLKGMEEKRVGSYESLMAQIKTMTNDQKELRTETIKLVQSLKSPTVRGAWGEMQLKRVVEITGMTPHCDFLEQSSVTSDNGRSRADMVVKLPGGKNVVVDAKAPLESYMRAIESSDPDERTRQMKEHAKSIRKHIKDLSLKSYWEQYQPTPDMVILFIPGENFLSAGMEYDKGLLEEGVNNNIILASPITLIALLRAIAFGWKQEKIASNAQKISKLGRELHDRLAVMAEHLNKVGRGLHNAVGAYNEFIGSYEHRALVSARKFKELGVSSGQEIETLEPIDKTVRLPADK